MKAWSRAACALAVAVATASSGVAGAHVVPQPTFLEAGSTATIALAGPNERDEPMTGFRVLVPADLRIVGAHGPDAWSVERDGEQEATWSGGSLASAAEATFHVDLEAPPAPGPVTLEAQQLYAGGDVVSWDVALTIVPGAETSGPSLGWAVAIALLIGGATAAIVAVAWLRWRRSGAHAGR